jgi:hypothetical protein
MCGVDIEISLKNAQPVPFKDAGLIVNPYFAEKLNVGTAIRSETISGQRATRWGTEV